MIIIKYLICNNNKNKLKIRFIQPKIPINYFKIIIIACLIAITTAISQITYNLILQKYFLQFIKNITISKLTNDNLQQKQENKENKQEVVNNIFARIIQTGFITTIVLMQKYLINKYYNKSITSLIKNQQNQFMFQSMNIHIWNKDHNNKINKDKLNNIKYFSFRRIGHKTLTYLIIAFFQTILFFFICFVDDRNKKKSTNNYVIIKFLAIVLLAEVLLSYINNVGVSINKPSIVTKIYLADSADDLFNPKKIGYILKSKYLSWYIRIIIIITFYYYSDQLKTSYMPLILLLVYKFGFFSGYLTQLLLYKKLLKQMYVMSVNKIHYDISDISTYNTPQAIQTLLNGFYQLPINIRVIRPCYMDYTISELLEYYGFDSLEKKYEVLHQVGILEQLRSINNQFLNLPLNYSVFSRQLLERIMITGALKRNKYLFVWDFDYEIPDFIMNHLKQLNSNYIVFINNQDKIQGQKS